MPEPTGPDRPTDAPSGKVQPIPDRIWVEFGRELTDDGSHQIKSREVVDGPDATPDYPYQETAEYVRAPAWLAGTVVGDAIAKLQRLSAEQEESLRWEAAQRATTPMANLTRTDYCEAAASAARVAGAAIAKLHALKEGSA